MEEQEKDLENRRVMPESDMLMDQVQRNNLNSISSCTSGLLSIAHIVVGKKIQCHGKGRCGVVEADSSF